MHLKNIWHTVDKVIAVSLLVPPANITLAIVMLCQIRFSIKKEYFRTVNEYVKYCILCGHLNGVQYYQLGLFKQDWYYT
jgi:hypothetical protein